MIQSYLKAVRKATGESNENRASVLKANVGRDYSFSHSASLQFLLTADDQIDWIVGHIERNDTDIIFLKSELHRLFPKGTSSFQFEFNECN